MPRVVLGVEDDDASYFLLQMAFRHLEAGFEIHRAIDGEQALAFLRRQTPYVDSPRPDLILLNLNMPRVSGFEVLETIQRDESLRKIPAVVFSSSRLDAERAKCLSLGAKQFISKPHSFQDLVAAVEQACSYSASDRTVASAPENRPPADS